MGVRAGAPESTSQPRTEFNEDALQELSASFASKGQLQPIRVRWLENEGKWTIIAGERRWRAAQIATVTATAGRGEVVPSTH